MPFLLGGFLFAARCALLADPYPVSLTFADPTVGGGSTGVLIVTMSEPGVARVTTDNPEVAGFASPDGPTSRADATWVYALDPTTLTGSVGFPTGNPAHDTPVTFTATANGVSVSGTVVVKATVPVSLTLDKSSISGGEVATATLTMNYMADYLSALTINIGTSDNNLAGVALGGWYPPPLSIPGPGGGGSGTSVGTFIVYVNQNPTAPTPVTVTATYQDVSISSIVLIKPDYPRMALPDGNVVADACGGEAVQAQLSLERPAGQAGETIYLKSTDPAVAVPDRDSVSFASGWQQNATFTIYTSDPTNWWFDAAAIEASFVKDGPAIESLEVFVKRPVPDGLQVDDSVLCSGAGTVGHVSLTCPPPSPATVLLFSDNASVVVPASVTVAAGSDSADFPITAGAVTNNVFATIEADDQYILGLGPTAHVAVQAPAPAALTIQPHEVEAGLQAQARLTLTCPAPPGGLQVGFAASEPAVQIQRWVTVPEGQIELDHISINTTNKIASTLLVQITASTPAGSRNAVLRVLPKDNCPIKSVTVAPAVVPAGKPAAGFVKLCQPATADTQIVMSSSDSSLAIAGQPDFSDMGVTGPAIVVPKGQDTAAFGVQTYKPGAVTITATAAGQSESAQLTISPASLESISINNHDPDVFVPEVLCGQGGAIGHVVLSDPAPDGGTTVYLRSEPFWGGAGDTHVQLPPTIQIDAGQQIAYFDIGTTVTRHEVDAVIEASLSPDFADTVQAELLIHPPGVDSVTLSPNNHVCGGETLTGTATLCGQAPADGLELFVQSTVPSAAWVEPTSISVPAGASSASFTVHTASVAKETDLDIRVGTRLSKRGYVMGESAGLVIDPTFGTLTFDQNPVVGGNEVTVTVTLCQPAGADGVSGTVATWGAPYPNAYTLPDSPLTQSEPDCDFTIPAGQTTAICHIRTLAITPDWIGLKTGANVSEVYFYVGGSESLSSMYYITVVPAEPSAGLPQHSLTSQRPTEKTVAPVTVPYPQLTSPTLYVKTGTASGAIQAFNSRMDASLAISPWPRFHADALNSGVGVGSGAEAVQRWAVQTGSGIRSSPAIGPDGTVYVGSSDGNVYALDGASGLRKWIFSTGGAVLSSPAVASDGTVYVGSADHNLYALDGATGQEEWRFGTGGAVSSSPAIGADGTIYFGSDDGGLYAIDSAGEQKWIFSTAGPIVGAPALGPDGAIYFGSRDQKIYALDSGGNKKWAFATDGAVESSPAVAPDGKVYAGSDDGSVYALDGNSGQLIWSYPAAGAVVSSPALGADGTIYIGSGDGLLSALDAASGQLKWSASTGDAIESSPAIGADGTIYVGSFDLNLYALNGTNGVKQWVLPLNDRIISSPAIGADGTIYVGGESGAIYAIGSAPGAPAIGLELADQAVAAGSNAMFTVVASGADPLSYQWRKDGAAISEATNATFTITGAQASDAGTYSVVVSNTAGSVTSNGAELTIAALPQITAQPQSQTRAPGGDAGFSVTASGGGLSYQWEKEGLPIAGATSSSYTIAAVASSDAATYTVVVSNVAGSVTSADARLTVDTTWPNDLAFDGGYVTVPDTNRLAAPFTIEAWGLPSASAGWQGIVGSREPSDAGFDLKFNGTAGVHADIGDGSSWLTTSADYTFSRPITNWVHVAYVVSAVSYMIVVNGRAVLTNSLSGGLPILYDGSHQLRIGDTGYAGESMRGQLDEIRIWNRLRSATEIAADYQTILRGDEPGLVHYYRFSDGQGDTTADAAHSVQSVAATLVGLGTGLAWTNSEPQLNPPVTALPALSAPGFSGGHFTFLVSGPENRQAVVQVSTNLVVWVSLSTNTISGGSFDFTDRQSSDSAARFYRAVLAP